MVLVMPTGSGKTLTIAHMLDSATGKGLTSWFVVHRRELIKQSIIAFDGEGVFHGVVSAGFQPDPRPLVQIAGIQTLVNRFRYMKPPNMIVWDECHHVAAQSWARIFKAFPKAYHIGLTATPERLDGKGLGPFFKNMVQGPTVKWLIEEGYLTGYDAFIPEETIDRSGVRKSMGELARSEIAAAADKPSITGDAIKEYRERCNGMRGLIFTCAIPHSEHVVQAFCAAGVAAEHVDGETDPNVRDAANKRFKEATTTMLSNVDLFGEGYDVPAAGCVVDLAPTESLTKYLQRFGRILRPVYAPGFDLETKEGRLAAIAAGPKPKAIYLDHAANILKHGLPDEERSWSLADRPKTLAERDDQGRMRTCSECRRPSRFGPPKCPYCGHLFEIRHREVEYRPGNLVQVTAEGLAARRLQDQARRGGLQMTFEDLERQAIARGEKFPTRWAHMMMQGQAARFRGRG